MDKPSTQLQHIRITYSVLVILTMLMEDYASYTIQMLMAIVVSCNKDMMVPTGLLFQELL